MGARHSDFERVYNEHVSGVYGYLAYRSGNRQISEELTQMTFERALRAWARFDPRRGSERTWLFAIAANLLIDHQRRRTAVPVADPGVLLGGSVPGPEQRFGGSPELLIALRSLSDREREVLALRYAADLTGPEIAELLGLSVANVQQVMSRALRSLRKLLESPLSAAPGESTDPVAVAEAD